MTKIISVLTSCFLMGAVAVQNVQAQAVKSDTAKTISTKKSTFTDKVKGCKKSVGLFTLYQDTTTGSVQLYIRKDQLDKEFIYQSFSINGPVGLMLNQNMPRFNSVFKIQKSFNKLEFSFVNTGLYYDPENPLNKTANVDKPVAVFYTDKFSVEDSLGYLVNGDGLFLSEKLDPVKPMLPQGTGPGGMLPFGLGALNLAKSQYAQLRSYPNNTDVVVDLTYDNPNVTSSGGADITDPRYLRIRMQHSFIEMPKNDFKTRRDDPRVGYFIEKRNDMTSTSATRYKDLIHRWNLVKKDPSAALSEPVEPIVFWVENTTPLEYRQTIMEAGLKWNEAFEKAGFKNAVQMKIMPDHADWEPSDVRYNVIRWVSSTFPMYGAIGTSFVNPRTGQILGADITIEWSAGSSAINSEELYNGLSAQQTPALPGANNQQYDNCSIATELKSQFSMGLTALEIAGASEAEIKEMHKQFLTYLIMHEMGHTLGLNHNMKGSQMLSPAEINNKQLTRSIGLMGSVMDYPAINVALDKSKQGDYYTTKVGPYDLWAIEYGYTPFSDSKEETELTRILSRSGDPKLAFGNDGDDMRSGGIDPRINVNDLTNDAIGYAEERFKLVDGLMGKLLQKYRKPGQSYAELRRSYLALYDQRSDMIKAVSSYIGGIYVDRTYPEQQSGNKPYTPVPLAIQKRAMAVLTKYAFAPNAFEGDAPLFPYLQVQRRGFIPPGVGEDFKATTYITLLQTISLGRILNPVTLGRINNTSLYGNLYSSTEIMNDLIKAIFDADLHSNVNVYRRLLQMSFLKGCSQLFSDNSPIDDISKASVFYSLKKLKKKLITATSTNEETKAHRANLIYIIDKALKTT